MNMKIKQLLARIGFIGLFVVIYALAVWVTYPNTFSALLMAFATAVIFGAFLMGCVYFLCWVHNIGWPKK